MRKIKITLEYEGSAYHGWQLQPNKITIQEILENCLEKVTQEKIRVFAAGRTDAGVHALGQVVHFKTASALPVETLVKALNHLLPFDIVVQEAVDINEKFHAQFDVKFKIYRYFILSRNHPSAFDYKYHWYFPHALNIEDMRQAAQYLIGEHDFTSFQAAKNDVENSIRNLYSLDIREEKNNFIFELKGNGFLKYMVRNIIGTLVEVGRGKIKPARIQEILMARDRRLAGPTAPARGLF